MKKFLFYFVIAASQIVPLQSTIPQAKTKAVVIMAPSHVVISTMFSDIMSKHLTDAYSQIDTNTPLTRKKNSTAAVLLNGIAQACAHMSSIFCANNQQDKHLGILNIVGTVLNVTAQLAEHSDKPLKPKEVIDQTAVPNDNSEHSAADKEQMACKLAGLTKCLLEALEKEHDKNPTSLPETLMLIRSTPSTEEQQELITSILATPKLAAQYLAELFCVLQHYVTKNGTFLTEIIRDKISDYLNTQQTSEHAPQVSATNLDGNSTTPVDVQRGLVLYANPTGTCTPEVLDYLTDQFITMLQNQLKQICGADLSVTTQQALDRLEAKIVAMYNT